MQVITGTRRRLWEGEDGREAQRVAAELATQMATLHRGAGALHPPPLEPPRPLVQHDTPVDAAAAAGRRERNASRRAEAVTVALTRLLGEHDHAETLSALQRAGIPAARAEQEIVRMLATDYLFEPRVGHYRVLDAS